METLIFQQSGFTYFRDRSVPAELISLLYENSGLKRPTRDLSRLQKMFMNSNLVLSAWKDEELVGVARSLTDFSYCCYLSDLAVKKEYQNKGMGKRLIALTKKIVGPQVMLLLLSAPNAIEYYPRIGFQTVQNGFIIKRES